MAEERDRRFFVHGHRVGTGNDDEDTRSFLMVIPYCTILHLPPQFSRSGSSYHPQMHTMVISRGPRDFEI
jgi:hypothetical protein